jgi:hypothetical protein
MSQLPITSRLKRTPTLKHAPAKQTEVEQDPRTANQKKATVYGDGTEKTVEVEAVGATGEQTKQVEKSSGGPGACDKVKKGDNLAPNSAACLKYKKHDKKVDSDPCYQYKNGSKKCPEGQELNAGGATSGDRGTCCKKKDTKKCPDGSPIPENGKCTKTETTPGVQGDLKTGTQGRVLQPWEINRLSRGVKSTTRKVNLASKRLDKIGAIRGADGSYSLPEGASPKDQRKFEKQNARLTQFRSQVKNSQIAIDSGRGAGELVRSGQRNTGQDELEGGQKGQEKFLLKKAEREAANEAAEATRLENAKNDAAIDEGIVTSGSGTASGGGQAEGAVGIPAASATGAPVPPTPGAPAGTVESGKYVDPNSIAKKRSSFKMTSKHPSISKMTAAQGKLPVGIQKAILAKEAKSGSGFKMRGYGKK